MKDKKKKRERPWGWCINDLKNKYKIKKVQNMKNKYKYRYEVKIIEEKLT